MDGMDRTARAFLESLFRSAVAAAHPAAVLPTNLPEPPARGRLVILAAGKAAGAMTEVAEQHYLALHRVQWQNGMRRKGWQAG